MAKLSINAKPTFKAKVDIPVHGSESEKVEMTFKHRTKAEIDEFIRTREDKTDAETFMDMVVGWEFEEEFCLKSVETMLQNYIGAGLATYRTYVDEIVKVKLGN